MHQVLRALRPEFVNAMVRRAGWPLWKHMVAWFERHGGIKSDYLSAMKHGKAVNERYLLGLIQMILNDSDADMSHCRAVVSEFVKGIGKTLTNCDENALLELLSTRDMQSMVNRTEKVDYLQLGFEGIFKVLAFRAQVGDRIRGCRDEDEVAQAIRWMFAYHGRDRAGSRLSVSEAIKVAEAHMTIPLADYQERAIVWWRFNPWTVMLAKGRANPIGVTIFLPVTRGAYGRIMSGTIMTCELLPADLTTPSSLLVVEGAGERGIDLGGERGVNASRAMFLGQFAQAAALSRYDLRSADESLTLLSFASSERTKNRLVSYGFQTTNRFMRRANVELFERVMRPSLDDFKGLTALAFFRRFAAEFDSPPQS